MALPRADAHARIGVRCADRREAVLQGKSKTCEEKMYRSLLRTVQAHSSDGSMDRALTVDDFRALLKRVFPDRPMTRARWEEGATMFRLIDQDNSGHVTYDEIFDFLERCAEHRRLLMVRPASLADWCDVLFCKGTQSWLRPDKERGLAAALWLAQFLDCAFSIIPAAVAMVLSLPSQQAEGSYYRGNTATVVLTAVSAVWLVVFVLGWTWGRLFSALPGRIGRMDFDAQGAVARLSSEERGDPMLVIRTALHAVVSSRPGIVNALCFIGACLYLFASQDVFLWGFPLMSVRMLACSGVLHLVNVDTPELSEPLLRAAYQGYVMCVLMLTTVSVSSSVLLFFERQDADFNFATDEWVRRNESDLPDAGRAIAFQSLVDGAWWGIVTITTVGYGDKYPATVGGQLTAFVTMLASMVIVSYPITILNDTIAAVNQEKADVQRRHHRIKDLHEGLVAYLLRYATTTAPGSTVAASVGGGVDGVVDVSFAPAGATGGGDPVQTAVEEASGRLQQNMAALEAELHAMTGSMARGASRTTASTPTSVTLI